MLNLLTRGLRSVAVRDPQSQKKGTKTQKERGRAVGGDGAHGDEKSGGGSLGTYMRLTMGTEEED